MTQLAHATIRPERTRPSAALPNGPSRAAAADDDAVAGFIIEAAKGDVRAFERIYALLGGRLLSIARGILQQKSAAEDVLQESFIRIWRSADKFDPAKGSAYAWIVTIVRNRAISAKAAQRDQRAARDDFDFEAIPFDGPDALSAMIETEEARRVRACVDRLPADNRRSLELVFFEGMTHRELAQRLSVPIGTAKSWVRRGLDRLGECLRGGAVDDWRERVAREYAVGTLQGPARRGFERRRERDARYCDFADWWERSLAMLTASLGGDRQAPARLWEGIRQAIGR